MIQVTREELKGITVQGLVTLYLNRLNQYALTPEQIRIDKVTRLENGQVQVVISPAPETTWSNGPVTVQVPPVPVEQIYPEEVPLDYSALLGQTLAQVMLGAELPPCPPTSVVVADFDLLSGGPHLVLSYRFNYVNAFFTGSLVVRINNAPNNLDALRILNNLFITPKDLP